MTRIRRILSANLNEMLERAEDPAKMVNYLVLEMEEDVERAREEVASAMANGQRLHLKAQEAEHAAEQWHQRARRAVEHHEDALASEAIRRRVAAYQVAEHYYYAYEQQQQEVAKLRSALEQLNSRLTEAKTRRTTILSQLQMGKAQQVIARSLRQSVVSSDAFSEFDRIAEQARSEQFRTAALLELSRDDVADAFIVSESTKSIEHELTAIKRELGYVEGDVAPQALEQHGEV